MTCPNCGAEINDNRRFCGKCGTEVSPAGPTALHRRPIGSADNVAVRRAPGERPVPRRRRLRRPPPPPAEPDPFAAPDLYAPPPGYAAPRRYPPPGYPPPAHRPVPAARYPPAGYPPGAWPGYGPRTVDQRLRDREPRHGLIGWLPCGVGSVLAIIFGFVARDQIKRSQGREHGSRHGHGRHHHRLRRRRLLAGPLRDQPGGQRLQRLIGPAPRPRTRLGGLRNWACPVDIPGQVPACPDGNGADASPPTHRRRPRQ